MSAKKTNPGAATRAYLSAIGKRGGKSRTAGLTPEERKELARKAARARWSKRKPRKQ